MIDPMIKPEWLDYMAKFYAGDNDLRDPLLSPIYADLNGFPPLLIEVGSDELILSDSERLEQIALKAGVEVKLDIWDKMWHV
jgi:epsilon-lactone hydrolase